MTTDVIARVKLKLAARQKWRALANSYHKYKEFTMIRMNDYINNLLVVEGCECVPGCVVECGTWRGGMIAGIADLLGAGRPYFLFDSFEGLPPAREIDGPAALAWQSDRDGAWYYDNCTAPIEYAQKAMAMSRATDYRIIKGWFEQTLPVFEPPEPIAVLRLDADWFDSTLVCLESLFRHMAPGGMIILDDYLTWDGCSKAVHQFLAKSSSSARISTDRGVCVLKPRQ
jgi:hypothetical protein